MFHRHQRNDNHQNNHRHTMTEKLQQGDRLPHLSFRLVDGEELSLPEGMASRYVALLFFRGAW